MIGVDEFDDHVRSVKYDGKVRLLQMHRGLLVTNLAILRKMSSPRFPASDETAATLRAVRADVESLREQITTGEAWFLANGYDVPPPPPPPPWWKRLLGRR